MINGCVYALQNLGLLEEVILVTDWVRERNHFRTGRRCLQLISATRLGDLRHFERLHTLLGL
jgi:hypothetical protein